LSNAGFVNFPDKSAETLTQTLYQYLRQLLNFCAPKYIPHKQQLGTHLSLPAIDTQGPVTLSCGFPPTML
jgi:hypothetical protein